MTKFNVGDEVKVTQNTSFIGDKKTSGWHVGGQGVVKIGAIGIVESVLGDFIKAKFKKEDVDECTSNFSRKLRFDEIELVESKPTKNKRITALEETVAKQSKEISELKLIVHELRGKKSIESSTTNTVEDIEFEGQQYHKVDREAREGDYVSVSFENGKCFKPNKLYGPVFFEDKRLKVKADPSSGGEYEITRVYHDLYGRTLETVNVYELMKDGLNPQISIVDETIEPLTPNQQRAAIIEKAKKFVEEKGKGFDFSINQNKRIIAFNIRTEKAAFAKCNPSDVSNEHIGKAIALGRALGLDVSEFEQAVQPTDFVSGQIIKADHLEHLGEHQLTKVENHRAYFDHNGEKEFHWAGRINEGDFHIINDTNAKYEVIK